MLLQIFIHTGYLKSKKAVIVHIEDFHIFIKTKNTLMKSL